MNFERIPYLTLVIWGILAIAFVVALFTSQWANAFVTIVALTLTLLPSVFSNRFQIQLPLSFLAAISLFLFATLFLGEIFDFYKELNNLIKECPYDSGVAYPLLSFQSPTLFVCRKGVTVCQHIDSSKKAVNIVKPLGELKPGRYHLCLYLTNKLKTFYKKHYVEIKEIVAAKEKSQ